MKRLIIFIALLFILTGCTANVDITVGANRISERISIVEFTNFPVSTISGQYVQYYPAFGDTIIPDTELGIKKEGVEYYRMSGADIGNGYNAFYQYDYNFNDYKRASSVSGSFRSVQIQRDMAEGTIMLSTDSGGMLYLDNIPALTEVRVNIYCDYKVIEHNADYVEGSKYTWLFTKDNNNKGIYLYVEDPTNPNGTHIDPNEKQGIPQEPGNNTNPGGNSGNNNNNNQGNNNGNVNWNDKPGEQNNNSNKSSSSNKVSEAATKHPYIAAFIGIGIFVVVLLFSFRIKKVQ